MTIKEQLLKYLDNYDYDSFISLHSLAYKEFMIETLFFNSEIEKWRNGSLPVRDMIELKDTLKETLDYLNEDILEYELTFGMTKCIHDLKIAKNLRNKVLIIEAKNNVINYLNII